MVSVVVFILVTLCFGIFVISGTICWINKHKIGPFALESFSSALE